MDFFKNNKTQFHFQRFEYKYKIPLNVVEAIIPTFLKHMDFDEFARNFSDKSYYVSSLYFDSIHLDCYHDKISGIRTRKKLRIRTYDQGISEETPMYLEIKKKYDNVVVKDRVRLSYKKCKDILFKNMYIGIELPQEEREAFNQFIWIKERNSMLPQNLVTYKRMAFASKVDPGFRVTIDYNIQTALASWFDKKAEMVDVHKDMSILEVKFNNSLPKWFHVIIQKYNLQRDALSKYCNSLELCEPRLIFTGVKALHGSGYFNS